MNISSTTRSLITVAVNNDSNRPDTDISQAFNKFADVSVVNTEVLHAHYNDLPWARAEHPLLAETVRSLLEGGDGFITVVVDVDKDRFLTAYAHGSHEDLVHERTFAFGLPNDCTVEIIGVRGSSFIVSYTTCISTQLPGGDDE